MSALSLQLSQRTAEANESAAGTASPLITSPPVVQHPSADGFTVHFAVSSLATGWIEWGWSADRLDHTAVAARHGLIRVSDAARRSRRRSQVRLLSGRRAAAGLQERLSARAGPECCQRSATVAGQPPFEKEQLADILAKVQRGDSQGPRAIAPETPAPLESICLKARALKAGQRYATPRADDIEHWLADEPVAAHADTRSAKSARWSRKHRGFVQAGSIALLLLLALTTMAALLINKERRQTAKRAQEKGSLANEKGRLFESERSAKNLARQQAADLTRALAENYFSYAMNEYDLGRLSSSHAEMLRAVSLLAADDPLAGSYPRVVTDRLTQGGRLLALPLRHGAPVRYVAFIRTGRKLSQGPMTTPRRPLGSR